MPIFQSSNDSADAAKGSAKDAVDSTKKAGADARDDAKNWGRSLKDSASESWDQARSWGKGTGSDIEGSLDSGVKKAEGSVKGGHDYIVDLGHPLVNRVVDGFIKVGGVGAVHAVSKETYRISTSGDTSSKSFEASGPKVGKEALQWGLVAGVYNGVTYGIEEARGVSDWKNALLGGVLTGVALSLTEPNPAGDKVVNFGLTGGAIATAAAFLRST